VMNQELAREILESKGIVVSLANNGEEGVAAVAQGEFDLVLMDMQMPVMDGCQASEKIRQFNRKLPIIAMTANAMAADRNKCLAAGMNDYVTKPINTDELFTVMARWVKPVQSPPSPPVQGTPGAAELPAAPQPAAPQPAAPQPAAPQPAAPQPFASLATVMSDTEKPRSAVLASPLSASEATPSFAVDELPARLDALLPLVRARKISALDLAQAYLMQWPRPDHKPWLQEIIEALDAFDFSTAETRAVHLLQHLAAQPGDIGSSNPNQSTRRTSDPEVPAVMERVRKPDDDDE